MKKISLFILLSLLNFPLFSQEQKLDNSNIYTKSPVEEKLFQAIFVPSAITTRDIILKEKLDTNKIHIQGISILQWAAYFAIEEQRFSPSPQCSLDKEGVLRTLIILGDDINHVAYKEKNTPENPLIFVPAGYPFLGNAIRIGNFFFIRIAFDADLLNPKNKLNIHWKDDKKNNYLHMFVDPTNKIIHTDLYAEHIISRPNLTVSIPKNQNGTPINEGLQPDEQDLTQKLKVLEQVKGGQVIDENKMKVTQQIAINDVVYQFIERGININEQNNSGDTPLHIALRASLILEMNKNRICKTETGHSLEEVKKNAQKSPNSTSAPKVIYYKDYYANAMTNLQLAIRELLAANADINIKNNNGETPLDIANKITNKNHPIRILMDLSQKGERPLNAKELRKKFIKTAVEKPTSSQIKLKEQKTEKVENTRRPPRKNTKDRPVLHLDIE